MKDYLQKALETGDTVRDGTGDAILIIAKLENAEYCWVGQLMPNPQVVLLYNDSGEAMGRGGSTWNLVRPVYKFEHWNLLHPRVSSIERIAEKVWRCEKVGAFNFRPALHEAVFPTGFFPNCPVGTVIENPNVCPF